MALSLSAEQKNLKNLFFGEDLYIIPEYQRPYSWDEETCFQMYSDITAAFAEKKEYFMGNIILARGTNVGEESRPEVVDGQQRLLTVWLWLKAMSLLFPSFNKLKSSIELQLWTIDVEIVPRIDSKVFEADDASVIQEIWKLDESWVDSCSNSQYLVRIGNRILSKNQLMSNFISIYSWLKEFYSRISPQEIKSFIDYFISQVYFLPIEMKGQSIDDAVDKALKIFETINNRGQNLESADIFKSTLYSKAKSVHKEKMFINDWVFLRSECDRLKISVDRLFRFYSHIIRGQQNIVSMEMNLREFFVNENYSPLKMNDFEIVIDELKRIINILSTINELRHGEGETSLLVSIMDYYTNSNPWFAVVTYMYKHESDDLVPFMKNLIRFCYSYGTSLSIRFPLYEIISDIMHERSWEKKYVNEKVELSSVNSRLKKGYVLLDYYLRGLKASVKGYRFYEFITDLNAYKNLDYEILSSLGNMYVMPKNAGLVDKDVDEWKDKIDSFKEIGDNLGVLVEIEKRDSQINQRLISFLNRQIE